MSSYRTSARELRESDEVAALEFQIALRSESPAMKLSAILLSFGLAGAVAMASPPVSLFAAPLCLIDLAISFVQDIRMKKRLDQLRKVAGR